MSHITIIINRAPPETDATTSGTDPSGVSFVSVSYTPPDTATDAEVGQAVKKLYKQVRDLAP